MSETRSNGIGHFVQPTAEGMVDAMAALSAAPSPPTTQEPTP